jgi:hypothetical protein
MKTVLALIDFSEISRRVMRGKDQDLRSSRAGFVALSVGPPAMNNCSSPD